MASSQKVLIILSDADHFDMKKTSGTDAGKVVSQPSGFFLMELAKPLSKLLEAGYEVTFATPEGKEPVPDPNSESLLAFAGNFYERRRENELVERMKKENGFSSPRKFRDISNEELESFRGVFIPGGHAPLTDLGDNKDLGRILEHFHGKQKPTAVICHGPYAFLSTKASSGKFLYAGYKLTSWSDMEESMMETMLGAEIPKVESALRAEGAEMVEGLAQKVGYITVDREVVSGANPMAADAMGDKFIQMMKA
ncbi:ThiJ/PfpI family protein [Aureobasidium sp. EXF-12298]|jgi:putative intracellular protease/amidase